MRQVIVRVVLGFGFAAFGLIIVAIGLRPAVTGSNYSGRLGRGFTAGDNARLARAPSAYFRALGAVVACLGGLIADIGALLIAFALGWRAWISLVALFALLVATLLTSLVVLLVLAIRYRLTRFDAP